MEPKVFTNRNSLAGSAAREAESSRAAAGSFRIEPGAAAHAAAKAESTPRWQNDEGLRINLRPLSARQPPPRLFPGPSARPVPAVAAAEPAVAAAIPVQQAPYPPTTPQSGTVTSIGRLKNAFRSLFT